MMQEIKLTTIKRTKM